MVATWGEFDFAHVGGLDHSIDAGESGFDLLGATVEAIDCVVVLGIVNHEDVVFCFFRRFNFPGKVGVWFYAHVSGAVEGGVIEAVGRSECDVGVLGNDDLRFVGGHLGEAIERVGVSAEEVADAAEHLLLVVDDAAGGVGAYVEEEDAAMADGAAEAVELAGDLLVERRTVDPGFVAPGSVEGGWVVPIDVAVGGNVAIVGEGHVVAHGVHDAAVDEARGLEALDEVAKSLTLLGLHESHVEPEVGDGAIVGEEFGDLRYDVFFELRGDDFEWGVDLVDVFPAVG